MTELAHALVLGGLMVPVAVAVRAVMLRRAAEASRPTEEDAFARAHGLEVERDDLGERTVLRGETLRIELVRPGRR